MRRFRLLVLLAGLTALGPTLGGCAGGPFSTLSERECMTRVMYFESNRSSEEGMLAVGTTVMNRIDSGRYPKTVCGVVGQPNQFAEGALSKPMDRRQAARIAFVADRVLAGERNDQIGGAMFFHTAGLTFPYTNMHYTAVAGGNAFYEKVPFANRALPTTRFAQARPVEPASAPSPDPPVALAAGQEPRSIDDLLGSESYEDESERRIASAGSETDLTGRY